MPVPFMLETHIGGLASHPTLLYNYTTAVVDEPLHVSTSHTARVGRVYETNAVATMLEQPDLVDEGRIVILHGH